MTICFWCGAVEDGGTTVAAAGGVVPSGSDAGKTAIGHRRAGQHGSDDVGVGVHPVDSERMGPGQAELVEEFPAEGWLQWRGEGSPVGLEIEGGIEAVDFGLAAAFGGEAFHLHEVETIEPMLLGKLAPKGSGGAGIRKC